jgi:hypothetical protein
MVHQDGEHGAFEANIFQYINWRITNIRIDRNFYPESSLNIELSFCEFFCRLQIVTFNMISGSKN